MTIPTSQLVPATFFRLPVMEQTKSHHSTTESPLQFLHILESLKNTPRAGWVKRGIESPESVSDHMYRMAVLCMMSQVRSSPVCSLDIH